MNTVRAQSWRRLRSMDSSEGVETPRSPTTRASRLISSTDGWASSTLVPLSASLYR
jgi:hypothetical protein